MMEVHQWIEVTGYVAVKWKNLTIQDFDDIKANASEVKGQ